MAYSIGKIKTSKGSQAYEIVFATIPQPEPITKVFMRAKHCEAASYVWRMNKALLGGMGGMGGMKDHNGAYIWRLHKRLNIHLLYGRPVFFDPELYENVILFEPYLD